jgi:thiamine-phosphate pyrophosphorylase
MKFDQSKPILYLITRGAGTEQTTARSPEFKQVLEQISAAVSAGIDVIQIREKRLTARVLFELTEQAVRLTRDSATRLLVNDRADVAATAGGDGVHLTTRSIDARTIRQTFGKEFFIGASTHSVAEARAAKEGGADFVVFGPVFLTASKAEYGSAVGINQLESVAREVRPFPVLALGGVTLENAAECLRAGAQGIAGISLFSEPTELREIVARLR